ncbi:hypothetical protein RKE25_22155 (plasmid) [Dyella sp. BiH032]|uniref:hypothetical protein n=1 Tax=Dyella sp. BiH032 TaxID=3075430 RepID=UPI002892C766|nr:hypothetical protein [Dyella sp. BiH032]WNL48435.1 hypothetical protein RKE25_22155 [Dyella sp. BiH032]
MEVALRQARKHAATVLRAQENRMAPEWGINTPLRRLQAMSRVLQERIDSAADKGLASVVFWHGKWLCLAAARACLAILEDRMGELVPLGAAA